LYSWPDHNHHFPRSWTSNTASTRYEPLSHSTPSPLRRAQKHPNGPTQHLPNPKPKRGVTQQLAARPFVNNVQLRLWFLSQARTMLCALEASVRAWLG
jgi:hypothetical protein